MIFKSRDFLGQDYRLYTNLGQEVRHRPGAGCHVVFKLGANVALTKQHIHRIFTGKKSKSQARCVAVRATYRQCVVGAYNSRIDDHKDCYHARISPRYAQSVISFQGQKVGAQGHEVNISLSICLRRLIYWRRRESEECRVIQTSYSKCAHSS